MPAPVKETHPKKDRFCVLVLPSLKLTVRPLKWMVGILLSYWEGIFSGAMFVSGRVFFPLEIPDSSSQTICKEIPFIYYLEEWPGCSRLLL